MTAKKIETAEQKLLKMLEASAGPGVVANKTEEKVVKKRTLLTIVKISNKVLLASVILACLCLVAEIGSGIRLLNSSIEFSLDESAVKRDINPAELIPVMQSLSAYLAPVEARNFFRPYEAPKSSSVEVVTEKNRAVVEKTKHLRLVGISWLDKVDTASVMLEDKEKDVTYFLKKGEKIGDIIVKTIYADSAVLGYKNEEMIIKYDKPQQ